MAFVKRFILCSGSLKDMAQAYGITYPTVSAAIGSADREDPIAEDQQVASPFEKLLRIQLAEGKIDLGTFKRLLAALVKNWEKSP